MTSLRFGIRYHVPCACGAAATSAIQRAVRGTSAVSGVRPDSRIASASRQAERRFDSWHALSTHAVRCARDVLEMLDRPDGLADRTFSVEHRVDSTHVWVALPVAYHRFCSSDPLTGNPPVLEEPDLWLAALRRVVSASAMPTAIAPVLPAYAGCPFVALLTNGDPTGLDRVFDDRYFMASAELNLLNTILFVGDD